MTPHDALARLVAAAMKNPHVQIRPTLVEAPCLWCGYNGEGYWQSETHAVTCPWRRVGGMEERMATLADAQAALTPPLTCDPAAAPTSGPPRPGEGEHEPGCVTRYCNCRTPCPCDCTNKPLAPDDAALPQTLEQAHYTLEARRLENERLAQENADLRRRIAELEAINGTLENVGDDLRAKLAACEGERRHCEICQQAGLRKAACCSHCGAPLLEVTDMRPRFSYGEIVAQRDAARAAQAQAERERDEWQQRWARENENLERVSAAAEARLADTPETVERVARLATFIRDTHHVRSHGHTERLGHIPGTNVDNARQWIPRAFDECAEPECIDARAALAALRNETPRSGTLETGCGEGASGEF